MSKERTVADAIRERIDIVAFIGRSVRLERAGTNFRGLCPFHEEKVPSFYVDPKRGIWHCFGDGSGGDVISFHAKIKGIPVSEAIIQLAREAGL